MRDTAALDPIDYIERWRQIVERRREYIDALYARLGQTTANYWASRADLFRPSVRRDPVPDPFLTRVLQSLTPEMVVLDVGAGGGRYAVPLSRAAKRVVAVEPSAAMVHSLREELRLTGIENVEIVESTWEQAQVEPADVVICSHVIYPLPHVEPFLRKLDTHARRLCFLYLNVGQPAWEIPELWRQFHGEPVRPQPTYIDAYNVLHQMGIYANVEIVPLAARGAGRGLDFDRWVEQFRERLVLDERVETTERLRAALREVLVETPDGWQLRTRQAYAAIIWWGPAGRTS
jgi:SAM-dependent methyltransferase